MSSPAIRFVAVVVPVGVEYRIIDHTVPKPDIANLLKTRNTQAFIVVKLWAIGLQNA